MGSQTTVVVVDDHKVLRTGMRQVLEGHSLQVIGEAGTTAAATQMIKELAPDVVLLDVGLPDDSVELVREVSTPKTRVIAYGCFEDDRLMARMLRAGAQGFLGGGCSPEELVTGIGVVMSGEVWTPSVDDGSRALPKIARSSMLSRRESQILGLLSRGLTTDDVAAELSLSPHTVRTHVKNAMRKLEATTRAHAIAIAMREHSIR
ncbi:MAG: response regulator transcription factor [Thermoleophilaceae bacterium]|nr:response regulator transcription factor [Thermoleophilaceae bacterium]